MNDKSTLGLPFEYQQKPEYFDAHNVKESTESKPEVYTNTFSLQIYTAEQLGVMLERNGFEVIHHYDMDGNDFIADKSLNILTVARKKSD